MDRRPGGNLIPPGRLLKLMWNWKTRHLTPLVLAALLAPLWVLPSNAGDDLAERRSAQRDKIRAASLRAAKSGVGATFGLLVIPVDFADARFPSGYVPGRDLAPRLTGEAGETLQHFVTTASGARCDLRVTVAPTVHLPDDRDDYLEISDLSLNVRPMATRALESVAETGFPFRDLDMDGPDGLAGTADDDGRVDGVLLLHAGPGTEDHGVIPAQQFYLEEPVIRDGVAADTYAVAGYRSGLGIWAHETLHLFGLEERYDPLLPSDEGDSEVHSRGGLGIFSVMAAGAWGTGDGIGCALPDGYSCWQLGWMDAVDLPSALPMSHQVGPSLATRQVLRVWTHGIIGSEFFLCEVRDPQAAAPFDAAVPGGSLVVYHVDETVPDGWRVVDADGYHLRARLVEADGDDGVREGLDEGSAADLFPGSLGVTEWTSSTVPDTDGYDGPSFVELTNITSLHGSVVVSIDAYDGPVVDYELSFSRDARPELELVVHVRGEELATLGAGLRALEPALGSFEGGGSTVGVQLVNEGGVDRWVPRFPVVWVPDPDLPPGSATIFRVLVSRPGWISEAVDITWQWDDNAAALAFTDFAPGGWEVDHPDGTTGATWHFWEDVANPVADDRPLYACTGTNHATPAAWPDVAYGFGAHALLTSPPLGTEVGAVQVIHAWDAEVLPTGAGMDGGTVTWVDPDGLEYGTEPVDDWPGAIAVESTAVIHGAGAFTGSMSLDASGNPLWRVDVFPVPTERPGPWRLRFAFASNSRNGDGVRRGWFLAEATALPAPAPVTAWPLAWDEAGLTWGPTPGGVGDQAIILRQDADGPARLTDEPLFPEPVPAGYKVSDSSIRPYLPGLDRSRHLLLVADAVACGTLASRPVVVMVDGGAAATPFVGAPWPNPAAGGFSFTVEVPDGAEARWRIYDVRGRLVVQENRAAGSHLVRWDGRDQTGRRAPAGVYFVKITGTTVERTHKVVLLR